MSRLVLIAMFIGGVSCSREATSSPFPYTVRTFNVTSNATSFAVLDEAKIRKASLDYPKAANSQAPLSLTGSDGTGLELVGVKVRAVVDGPLAFTEMQLTFHNPQDRQREGRFEIILPPGAAVSRFAMMIGSKWQESEVVERMKARQVYESFLHQRVDPALLETKAGNAFRARVFPIAAKENKEIIISYSHELASAEEPYRLSLAGLPRMKSLDIHVRNGDRIGRLRRRNFKPKQDFEVEVDHAAPAIRAEDMIAVRVTPEVRDNADPLTSLYVLFDTSASGAATYQRQVATMGDLATSLTKRAPSMRLTVEVFDQTVELLYSGPVEKFGKKQLDALLSRRALGASNLELALQTAARSIHNERVLLISDGIVTAGAKELAELRKAVQSGESPPQRLDVLAMTSARDETILRGISAGVLLRDGVLLSPTAPADEWARRLSRSTSGDVHVKIHGANWVWPKTLGGLQAGDQAIVFATMNRGTSDKRVRVSLRGDGVRNSTEMITLAEGERPLLVREWAQARIDSLLAEQAQIGNGDAERSRQIRQTIIDLSMRHRVVTPLTAMLVLETNNDYRRFGLSRTALADIISIDATGLRVMKRGAQSFKVPSTFVAGSKTRTGQSRRSKTAGISGRTTDRATGEPLAGVTIVATSPALQGTQSAVTDGAGRYQITNLRPGAYQLTYYYSDITVRKNNVAVQVKRTTPVFVRIDTSQAGGETIVIEDRAATIDPASTTQGITLSQDYIRNIPIPGRTFESALGAAAGSSGDSLGVSFSGSTSLENSYIVDGVNTTGLTFGTVGKRSRSRWVAAANHNRDDATPAERQPLNGSSEKMRDIMKGIGGGDVDDAIAAALRWRASAPGDIMAVLALGEALEAGGYYVLAGRAYGSIADLYPSRAEMIRYAAARLLRLGDTAASLAADLAKKAVDNRPDHPSGYRLLALAKVMAGDHAGAFGALEAALDVDDPRNRFAMARELFKRDLGIIAAAWLSNKPAERIEIRKRLSKHNILVPMERSLSVVLSWETDANDVDLFVHEANGKFDRRFTKHGRLLRDISDGFGPEAFLFRDDAPTTGRYHLWAHYANQNMMGHGFGYVQILAHDGVGGLHIETRPFAITTNDARVDLGILSMSDYRGDGRIASKSAR